jgi:hypothetical protein
MVEEVRWLLPEGNRREPLVYRQAAALKALLLLDDWCRSAPVQRLEERFQMHLGQIMVLGETAAHLMTGVSALVAASNHENPLVEQLCGHAFSLRYGMPVDLRGLHRHFGMILNRSELTALHKAGVAGLADLDKLNPEELAQLIGKKDKLELFNKKVEALRKEVSMDTSRLSPLPAAFIEPESVEIDGTLDRERFLVKVNGFSIRLTGKSFKYFTKLAWSRIRQESGWMYKEDIEVGFNQARYLYRMKNEINAGLNSQWPVVENNRLGYYRLSVAPEKIRINVRNLRDHPDFEVRSLFSVPDATRPSPVRGAGEVARGAH